MRIACGRKEVGIYFIFMGKKQPQEILVAQANILSCLDSNRNIEI